MCAFLKKKLRKKIAEILQMSRDLKYWRALNSSITILVKGEMYFLEILACNSIRHHLWTAPESTNILIKCILFFLF